MQPFSVSQGTGCHGFPYKLKNYLLIVNKTLYITQGTKIENEIKGGYVNDWEDARTESNTYQLDSLENGYKDTIKYYTTEIEREERIHSEMKKYLTEMISVST